MQLFQVSADRCMTEYIHQKCCITHTIWSCTIWMQNKHTAYTVMKTAACKLDTECWFKKKTWTQFWNKFWERIEARMALEWPNGSMQWLGCGLNLVQAESGVNLTNGRQLSSRSRYTTSATFFRTSAIFLCHQQLYRSSASSDLTGSSLIRAVSSTIRVSECN